MTEPDNETPEQTIAELFPLIWSNNVDDLISWLTATLGLTVSWQATNDAGETQHAELCWLQGKVSLNVAAGRKMGPTGLALRVDDRQAVDVLHQRARAAGANLTQGINAPEESRVAYSFTAVDMDGNQWWVNAETGFLDQIRGTGSMKDL